MRHILSRFRISTTDNFFLIFRVRLDIFIPRPPLGYLIAPTSIRQEESKSTSSLLLRTFSRQFNMASAFMSSIGRKGMYTGRSNPSLCITPLMMSPGRRSFFMSSIILSNASLRRLLTSFIFFLLTKKAVVKCQLVCDLFNTHRF